MYRSANRRRWIIICSVVVILAVVWVGTWLLRWEIGLIRPTANLRYFYYAGGLGSFSDRCLYVLYYPLYAMSEGKRFREGVGRTSVHWSDRAGGWSE